MSLEMNEVKDMPENMEADLQSGEEDAAESERSSTSEESTSEDSEDETPVEEIWTNVDNRRHFPFTDLPAMYTGSAKAPTEYFKLFFDTTFMQLLASCINMHAVHIATKQFSVNMTEFKPVDVEEVYTLLGIYFLMGYVKVNEWAYYWGAHPLYNLKFENYMSKDRFSLLIRSLAYKSKHVCDDNGDSRRSWYDAAKPIADYFNATMKRLIKPSKELMVDKYTAHWFNELNLMRKKPEHIRMHLLSDKSGIFQRVYICHPDSKNKGRDIAKILIKDFLNTGRSLYSCPFYTSVSLAEELLEKKTYLTGILKRKRHRNPEFVKKKLKIGSVKALFNSKGVCVCNFRKSHTVLGLSTEHNGNLIVRGKSTDPEMTALFKEHTKVMFKRNQTLSDNSPSDVTKKYNRTVLYLLQVMLINAYLIYNIKEPEKLGFSDFRRRILDDILPLPRARMNSESEEDTDASLDSSDLRTDDAELIHLPTEVCKGRKRTSRNCRNCYLERGVRKRTLYYCPQCPQKWGLCIGCFREFHNY